MAVSEAKKAISEALYSCDGAARLKKAFAECENSANTFLFHFIGFLLIFVPWRGYFCGVWRSLSITATLLPPAMGSS